MKKFNKISVKDFWSKYSKDSIHFSKHPDLPLKLNLTIFFDVYFGRLTNHDFVVVNKNEVLLKCKNCIHLTDTKFDICSAHIGIIKGQIKNLLDSDFDLLNSINENICTIKNV